MIYDLFLDVIQIQEKMIQKQKLFEDYSIIYLIVSTFVFIKYILYLIVNKVNIYLGMFSFFKCNRYCLEISKIEYLVIFYIFECD